MKLKKNCLLTKDIKKKRVSPSNLWYELQDRANHV